MEPRPINVANVATAEVNSPSITLSFGTVIAISLSFVISGVLLWICGVLSGMFIQARVKKCGKKADTHSSGDAPFEVPASPNIGVVTSQEIPNPVYEVIHDVPIKLQANVQLCDNVAYGQVPDIQ